MALFTNTPPRSDPQPSPTLLAIAAQGEVAKVLFRTLRLADTTDVRLCGLHGVEHLDDAPAPPSLPPILTFECYEKAKESGLALRPGLLVTDATGILLNLRWPRDENGVMCIGMARLTQDLIRGMFAAMQSPPPVLLTLEEAAALIRIAPDTLKHWVSDGRIRRSVKRGKPLVFVRDLLVQEAMAD